jgi:DNA-binding CsgD family transcriptional regulator
VRGHESDDHALAALSEQQIALLRLVARGTTSSKALARETGLQPASIDTYLHGAARMLGRSGRAAAAARMLELENELSQSGSQLRRRHLVQRLKSAVYRIVNAIWQFASGLPIGGRSHAHSWTRVGLEIVRVAILGLAALFALTLFVLGFLRTFR